MKPLKLDPEIFVDAAKRVMSDGRYSDGICSAIIGEVYARFNGENADPAVRDAVIRDHFAFMCAWFKPRWKVVPIMWASYTKLPNDSDCAVESNYWVASNMRVYTIHWITNLRVMRERRAQILLLCAEFAREKLYPR